MLRISDINHIISESGCWEDVVNKVSKLKFRNVPATFKAYAIINDWGVEECDDISELYYEKIAKLLNEFEVIEPYEYDQYGITLETDFHELMDIHIKYNRVSKSVPRQIEFPSYRKFPSF